MKLVSALMVGILVAGGLRAGVGVDVPGVAGDEPYLKQSWPRARVLVWAEPGTSGYAWNRIRIPGSSVMVWNLALWTEYDSAADYLAKKEGRPATQMPDKDTDIILPEAPDGKPYVVDYAVMPRKRLDGLYAPQWTCRHITVGKGAGLDGGKKDSVSWNTGVEIYGNVTVKDGGYVYGPHTFLGDRHTFVKIGDSPEPLCVSWTVRKAKDASVTLLDEQYDLAERIAVESGRLVLPPKCQLRFAVGYEARIAAGKLPENESIHFSRPSYVSVLKDGVLEMGAGSRISRVLELEERVGDFRIDGLLQIGRAGAENTEPATIELTMAEGDGGFLAQPGGLYIRRTGQVKNLGKLAITVAPSPQPSPPAREGEKSPPSSVEGEEGETEDAAASTNKGVSVFLENTVDLGDVSLDYLRPGGIAARDLEMAKAAVARATFSEHCAAKGDDLFSTFEFIDFQGGVGTVEFVDGLKTECKILFPHAGRLMVRGKGNRTLQSFDLKSVHAITIDGRRTEFSAERPLNDQEKDLREKNPLWGDVPGKGQYGKYADQQWPDCQVMIWAQPGASGLRFEGGNWLDETGAPYFETPLGAEGHTMTVYPVVDILMPAADTPYSAGGWCAGGNESTPPCRHLTVEYNATYGITYNVQGNLWMKHGSGLLGRHRGRFSNTQPNVHRFLRYDGQRQAGQEQLRESWDTCIAQWGDYRTGLGGTLEMIGEIIAAADRLYINGPGTLILSEGSLLADGARAAVSIGPDATVALLPDARIGTESRMQCVGCASVWVSGTLMFGLPDKPIQKDTVFPLSGLTTNLVNRTLGGGGRSPGASLIVSDTGRIVTHSADPKKARVIVKMYDSERSQVKNKSMFGDPDGIVCYLGGKAELNGVVFDDLLEGGIMVPPATRATWKNVSYGEHNRADPEKLYWDLEPTELDPKSARTTIMLAATASPQSVNSWQEGAWRAFDGTPISRFRTKARAAWLQYRFGEGKKKVETYAVTSADDKSARDPQDWTLQGSNDGEQWNVLDERSGEAFSKRHQRREFKVSEPGDYAYYRLDITKNRGAEMLQVAEIELLAAEDVKKEE